MEGISGKMNLGDVGTVWDAHLRLCFTAINEAAIVHLRADQGIIITIWSLSQDLTREDF